MSGNTAAQSGGGVYMDGDTSVDATRTVFNGNIAQEFGGAMHLSGRAHVVISHASFLHNTADRGGGAINAIGEVRCVVHAAVRYTVYESYTRVMVLWWCGRVCRTGRSVGNGGLWWCRGVYCTGKLVGGWWLMEGVGTVYAWPHAASLSPVPAIRRAAPLAPHRSQRTGATLTTPRQPATLRHTGSGGLPRWRSLSPVRPWVCGSSL